MPSIALTQGSPQRISRGGAMLHVINHPGMDYNLYGTGGLQVGQMPVGFLLVGFDRVPSRQAYDAVVPPLTEALIRVPDDVKTVNLLWPLDASATTFYRSSPVKTMAVIYDWTECETAPFTRDVGLLPVAQATSSYIGYPDNQDDIWMPSRWTTILDQALYTASYRPHLRPALAPSRVVTKTGLLAANTLTTIPNVVASNTWPGSVLKRLIISASGAGLVVVGTFDLVVASVSSAEVARLNFVTATPQPVVIDFGEGLQLGWDGSIGAWKYYASTAITVDITAILG